MTGTPRGRPWRRTTSPATPSLRSGRSWWRARRGDTIAIGSRFTESLDELLDGNAVEFRRNVFGKAFFAIGDLRRWRQSGERGMIFVIVVTIVVIFIVIIVPFP